MPEYLPRRTAQIVEQYANTDIGANAETDPTIGDVATEALMALRSLLAECTRVDRVTKRGFTPRIPTAKIREIIGSNLEPK